jgi:hypothetical protein
MTEFNKTLELSRQKSEKKTIDLLTTNTWTIPFRQVIQPENDTFSSHKRNEETRLTVYLYIRIYIYGVRKPRTQPTHTADPRSILANDWKAPWGKRGLLLYVTVETGKRMKTRWCMRRRTSRSFLFDDTGTESREREYSRCWWSQHQRPEPMRMAVV